MLKAPISIWKLILELLPAGGAAASACCGRRQKGKEEEEAGGGRAGCARRRRAARAQEGAPGAAGRACGVASGLLRCVWAECAPSTSQLSVAGCMEAVRAACIPSKALQGPAAAAAAVSGMHGHVKLTTYLPAHVHAAQPYRLNAQCCSDRYIKEMRLARQHALVVAAVMCASLLQACASVQPVNPTASLRMKDAQGLVLWVLADGANPRWAFVKVRPPACAPTSCPLLPCRNHGSGKAMPKC